MLLQTDFGPVIESRNPSLRESTENATKQQKLDHSLYIVVGKGI